MPQQPTPLNWISIALLGLIWGATFMVVATALEGYGPLTVACARTTLGAIAMLALMVRACAPLAQFHAADAGLSAGHRHFSTPRCLLPCSAGGNNMCPRPLRAFPWRRCLCSCCRWRMCFRMKSCACAVRWGS